MIIMTRRTTDYSAAFERRMRTVSISPELLLRMCMQGNHINATCIEGLPPDTQLYGADYDAQRECFVLDVFAPSFDPVPDGERYPELTITFRTEHAS